MIECNHPKIAQGSGDAGTVLVGAKDAQAAGKGSFGNVIVSLNPGQCPSALIQLATVGLRNLLLVHKGLCNPLPSFADVAMQPPEAPQCGTYTAENIKPRTAFCPL